MNFGSFSVINVKKHTSEKENVKHETAKEIPEECEDSNEVKELKGKIDNLKKLHKEGFLSEEGFKNGIEQVEAQIEELNK